MSPEPSDCTPRRLPQWLVFWLILVLLLTVEKYTRVLLSTFPHYYEVKLCFLSWLLFRGGQSPELSAAVANARV